MLVCVGFSGNFNHASAETNPPSNKRDPYLIAYRTRLYPLLASLANNRCIARW